MTKKKIIDPEMRTHNNPDYHKRNIENTNNREYVTDVTLLKYYIESKKQPTYFILKTELKQLEMQKKWLHKPRDLEEQITKLRKTINYLKFIGKELYMELWEEKYVPRET